MSEAAKQQIEGLRGLLDKLSDAYELRHNSAHAAAAELVQNWEAALGDGTPLAILVGDVDTVVDLLQKFKQDAASLELGTAPAPGR